MYQRLHFTNKEKINLNKIYKNNKEYFYKPLGLWYSLNTEWQDWCIYNNYEINKLKNIFELEIDDLNILKIKNAKEFIKYNIISFIGAENYKYYIFNKTILNYDGFEIINYKEIYLNNSNNFYKFKLHIFISGFDCSSGCIWNLNCIKNIKKI